MSVRIGTPITTAQAVTAILRCIDSSILGDLTLDSGPGHTFQRVLINVDPDTETRIYDVLSTGEQRLVDIAYSVWRASDDEGARVAAIGGIDRHNRRKVLMVLAYLYLGDDLTPFDEDEFAAVFATKGAERG